MYFDDLQTALIRNLQRRLFNGEFTERQLAKLARVSQPHIHNVLKGTKHLSNLLSDQILRVLGITVLDLIDRGQVEAWIRDRGLEDNPCSFVRVLEGLIGPGHPWPMHMTGSKPFPIRSIDLARMEYPVAVRLADDPQMHPVFSAGDWVILDQSQTARLAADENSFYLVKIGGAGLIRRIRMLGPDRYILTEATAGNPLLWERIDAALVNPARVIRARVRFLPPGTDWWTSADFLVQETQA
jgi:hypothetical protein